jgi:hypothetical protein
MHNKNLVDRLSLSHHPMDSKCKASTKISPRSVSEQEERNLQFFLKNKQSPVCRCLSSHDHCRLILPGLSIFPAIKLILLRGLSPFGFYYRINFGKFFHFTYQSVLFYQSVETKILLKIVSTQTSCVHVIIKRRRISSWKTQQNSSNKTSRGIESIRQLTMKEQQNRHRINTTTDNERTAK